MTGNWAGFDNRMGRHPWHSLADDFDAPEYGLRYTHADDGFGNLIELSVDAYRSRNRFVNHTWHYLG
jgi:hypothetical protein